MNQTFNINPGFGCVHVYITRLARTRRQINSLSSPVWNLVPEEVLNYVKDNCFKGRCTKLWVNEL